MTVTGAQITTLEESLTPDRGRVEVIVRFKEPSAAKRVGGMARGSIEARQIGAYKARLRDEQSAFMARAAKLAPGMKELGRVQIVLNAVFLELDAKYLPSLARDPSVERIAPVGNYRTSLSETVPLIGAAAVQAGGVDGSGVRIAVLDSGTDYTHANLGGPGTLAAYQAAIADQASRDGLFPTPKVVDGFDFVGPVWPNGALAPDEDPIPIDTHGTHVSDIAAGLGGVAPGASIISVKVCSDVSLACSGVALIQGMDFALDPNGDGNMDDKADVINMSLGADYGQPFDDDLSLAVDNATAAGTLTVAASASLTRTVRLRSFFGGLHRFQVTPTFRFADDAANGAVTVSAPSTVEVPNNSDITFDVTLTIDGSLLRSNLMNSGSGGANPGPLTANEYDGYLTIDEIETQDGGEDPLAQLHLAWHVLPRKAARVVPDSTEFNQGGDSIGLSNTGVGTAQNDAYSLVATGPDLPEGGQGQQAPTPDIRAFGVNTFLVPPSFCSSEFVWVFAVNAHERRSHINAVSYLIFLDTTGDGVDDFVVLNRDLSFNNITDGRNVTFSFDLSTGSAQAFFFTEHNSNTANTVLTICGEQIGLSARDLPRSPQPPGRPNTNVRATVIAQDFLLGGPGGLVGPVVISPLGERFVGLAGDIAANSSGSLTVLDFGDFPGNTSELGVLLFTNGDRGPASRGAATADTEALLFTVAPSIPPE